MCDSQGHQYNISKNWQIMKQKELIERRFDSFRFKKASHETLELQKHIANAEQNIIELRDTSAAIDRALHRLSQYRDGDFRKIPDSDQEELFTLVNLTQALSGILSQNI